MSLAAQVPGQKGGGPHEIIALRMEAVREDYIGLVSEPLIVYRRAREWRITKRQAARYLAVVKARYQRERDESAAAYQLKLEKVVEAAIVRTMDTERRAREAGEFKAETAAQQTIFRGVERLCIMRGLDSARKLEIADGSAAPENPFRLRARIREELRRAEGAPSELADRVPEGSA